MMGISWGGFNALQVAARRPPALKAIITLCATDDRYADECHYMGGCLLNNSIAWGSTMFAFGAQPPDPEVVGARWRDMWLAAAGAQPALARDVDRAIRSATPIGGKARCARTMPRSRRRSMPSAAGPTATPTPCRACSRGLTAPKKGLIGPWAHAYPQAALPGPAIGFLQEALRWWDHWLKGIDNGIMDEPLLRAVDAGERAAGHHLCRAPRPLDRGGQPGRRRQAARWRSIWATAPSTRSRPASTGRSSSSQARRRAWPSANGAPTGSPASRCDAPGPSSRSRLRRRP